MNTRQRMELFDTLERLFVGDLQPHESQQLARQLAEDPEARDYYAQLVRLDVGLAWSFGTQPQLTLAANPAASQLSVSAPVSIPISGPADGTCHRSPVLGFLDRVTGTVNRPVLWSVLAVGVLFTGYFAVISWNMLGKQLASGSKSEIRNSESVINTVAMIRGTSEVEWSQDSKTPLDSQGRGVGSAVLAITQNQQLQITSGLIELELTGGTTLLIEGPADWEITGSNSAKLTRGKLVAKVPQQAIGFTLETPMARIVDLGTEFGVEVGSGGIPEVHVLQGLVDVQALGNGKASPPIRLQAGESVRIRGDGSQSPVERSEAKKFMRLADRKTPLAREHSASTRLIDLSKGAVASQSSIYSPAANAIDGNFNTFSHTSLAGDRTPWWQVDLGRMRAIASVVVVNRLVIGKSRLRNITIKLLADDGVTEVATSPLLNPGNKDWGGVRDDRFGPTQLSHDFRTRAGEPLAARFVRIERTPEEEDRDDSDQGNPVLTIGEVQIFENADAPSVQK